MMNSTLPKASKLVLLVFAGLALLAPLPYSIISPGNAINVVEKVITPAKGLENTIKTYKSDGELMLLTIMVTYPNAYVTGGQAIYSWMRADQVVLPKSVLYTPGLSVKAEEKKSTKEMVDSQLSAKQAALNYLQSKYYELRSIKPSDIRISLADTGGPSAGAAFALGIIELLTEDDLLDGRKIAVTGTISATGDIGEIGGVNEKIIAAKKAGATLVLIPVANCKYVDSIPEGIEIAAVSSLDQAIAAFNSANPLGCASVGA
jgi:PDZ domain-containing protein